MDEFVIIGNGVAAAGCIEGIRSTGNEGKITVISAEKHGVYCRPLISYYLEDKTDTERMKYRDDGFYEDNNCDVIFAEAVKIDKENSSVILDNGETVPYSKLCVATGSSPFIPSFEGIETVEKKFSFMTLDDALTLKSELSCDKDVLIIGAGLIGLKCAEGIYGKVRSITVCDLADRILSSILDEDCAKIMQSHLESRGIKIMTGDSAVRFEGKKAVMKSGKTVDFDILVIAVGVRPNTSLIKDIGGNVNRGIAVGSNCETSVENIYAAGDCTECTDISDGKSKVIAIMPNAYIQGFTAGVNMAGGNAEFDNSVPMNSIGFFGLHAMTAGSYGGSMYEEKSEGRIKRLFTENDRLTGFMLIGYTERAGIYTSLIREKTPLSSLDFDALRNVADFTSFPAESRRHSFGGEV